MAAASSNDLMEDSGLRRLAALRESIRQLSAEHDFLQIAVEEADLLLEEVGAQREQLLELNRSLARAAADSAELVAEIEEKNAALEEVNRELSQANARAAELIGEIESKNERIDTLNKTLALANATAGELVAELEIQREELAKANEALRATNEEKGHILGVVAHDLRSGIGGMSGLADLLVEELPPDAALPAQYVSLIQEESRRLLHLLSTLLDMSRLEQGRLYLQLEILDLRPLVTEAVEFHVRFATNKQQHIHAEISNEPLLCAFDPVRLRQVLDNLLSNAIKYTPPGREIMVSARQDEGKIVVEIMDRGPGLTAGDATKVFRSFQQLSARPTGGEDSHGLGLAIAKKVVDSHHGEIWARNRPDGPGAVFGFSLTAR